MSNQRPDADQFLVWLREQIPLVQAMAVSRITFDGDTFRMYLPLAENVNDKGTGFGGSMAAAATLSGWCLTTLALRQRDLGRDVVVKTSTQSFLAPITGDFYVECKLPAAEVAREFFQRVAERGRGRWDLEVGVYQDGELKMSLSGQYVAFQREQS